MTIDEFLEELKLVKHKYTWSLTQTGLIRGDEVYNGFYGDHFVYASPLSAIKGQDCFNARYVGDYLDLSEGDIDMIIHAEDNRCGVRAETDLRNQILAILGLGR